MGLKRARNNRSIIFEMKLRLEIGLQLEGADLSREWPFSRGVTGA